MDVSGGHPELATMPLVTIWVVIVISIGIGFILDVKGACTVDPTGK